MNRLITSVGIPTPGSRRLAAVGGLLVLVGCGNALGPEDLARIERNAGNSQIAPVGTPVATPPSVKAVDEKGQPIPGVTVTFEITSGGGTVTGAQAKSNKEGIATVGGWTLGPTIGENTLTATAPGAMSPVVFTAAGTVGPASLVEKLEGDGQTFTAGRQLPIRPKVRVTDQFGNAVANVDVTFQVASGGGTTGTFPITTNAAGEATSSGWTLGATPGPNTLTATAAGASATFTATGQSGPVTIAIAAGDSQSTVVGTVLPNQPQALITDALGLPVPGAVVVFNVQLGGGSISADTVLTDANGLASVTWTLGTIAGQNLVAADAPGLGTVVFVATGLPDAPAALSVAFGDQQFGAINQPLAFTPGALVTDQFGNPVPGVSVNFAVTGGGGSVLGAPSISDSVGVASPQSWTLGPATGANTLEASVAGLTPITFTATALTAVYDIEVIRIGGGGGPGVAQAFTDAELRWESVIVGDLPDVDFSANPLDSLTCGPNPMVADTVDDLRIYVQLQMIDGPGNVLGSAGPCATRSGTSTSVVGFMRFDIDDVNALAQQGILGDVILHEMGHILGVGTLWGSMLVNPSLPNNPGADTHFTGPLAITAFDAVGGTTFGGSKVPVENSQGGQGTRDSHWRESTFNNELMTGFVDPNSNPMSIVTIQSLADLGYTVNAAGADPYSLPGTLLQVTGRRAGPTTAAPAIQMVDDIRHGPIYSVDRYGNITAVMHR